MMLHKEDIISEIVKLLEAADERELMIALEFIRSLTRR